MKVRLNCRLLLVLLIAAVNSFSQSDQSIATLNIGDAAPPLRLRAWLKGTPVKYFEKDKLYVVEFWATWCKPCVAAMPHLSALAHQYKDKVTFIGISIYENKKTSLKRIKSFVDSLGQQIDYNVAPEDSNYMATAWVDALAEPGIPRSFIIDREGKIAWTGHPEELGEYLPAIINNTWDSKQALTRRNENRRLAALDREVEYLVLPYVSNEFIPNHPFKPDTVLKLLNDLAAKEPGLKYAPLVTFYSFGALLHTDLQKAYEYGKAAIITPSYDAPFYDAIISNIEQYGDTLHLPVNFYQLGIEAWQLKINAIPYPQLVNLPRMYKKMAAFYWRAGEKTKAAEAIQKATDISDSRKETSTGEMAELKFRREEYTQSLKAF